MTFKCVAYNDYHVSISVLINNCYKMMVMDELAWWTHKLARKNHTIYIGRIMLFRVAFFHCLCSVMCILFSMFVLCTVVSLVVASTYYAFWAL